MYFGNLRTNSHRRKENMSTLTLEHSLHEYYPLKEVRQRPPILRADNTNMRLRNGSRPRKDFAAAEIQAVLIYRTEPEQSP